jgi:hypothetical protein
MSGELIQKEEFMISELFFENRVFRMGGKKRFKGYSSII